jgi:hypothetical protein
MDTTDLAELGTVRFSGQDMIRALAYHGIHGGRVEQTGGGTATAYWDLPTGWTLTMGPGAYGARNEFDTAELFAGVQMVADDGEVIEEPAAVDLSYNGSFPATFGRTVAAILALVADYR